MLLPFNCGIPKQLFFEREEAFVLAFILELSCMLSSGGEGRAWTSATVLAPQQKVMCNPFPRLHSCAQMEWERWDSSVLSLADVTTSSLRTSLCIFFSILMHASIFLAEENQLMQAYAKSRKKKAIWSGSGLVFSSCFSFFVLLEQDLQQWLVIT